MWVRFLPGAQSIFMTEIFSIPKEVTRVTERLEKAGIIVNKNAIPNDPQKPWDPSGIRLGTPAATTQGMKEKDMVKIAKRIKEALISST